MWEWDGEWQDRLEAIKAAGFCGVEYTPPREAGDDKLFHRQLRIHHLQYIAQVVTRGERDHRSSFREQVYRAAKLEPVLINSHSATDDMPFEEQIRFFEAALELESEIGIPIVHETHRGRAFFTPWQTAAVLRQLHELKVGADFSHWCVVMERLPDPEQADVKLAMSRAVHIHGRVGYEEGPQVPDPRAPEYAREVEVFLDYWIRICKLRLEAGASVVSFTPEFGPPGYQHSIPFTREPVGDLWEINLWMMNRFKQRFEEWKQTL
ncbi:sugar phosphate isomerase/epimerase family protein [Paenibacillus wynnii]|uniref:sugar phosphate isomerase/epimerase family protein n=1 Tax=Paenibacillus wynnii TaxID=268407 RepID=UPI000B17298D|nr:xylose isomerase [Paenibacillus wynnii]